MQWSCWNRRRMNFYQKQRGYSKMHFSIDSCLLRSSTPKNHFFTKLIYRAVIFKIQFSPHFIKILILKFNKTFDLMHFTPFFPIENSIIENTCLIQVDYTMLYHFDYGEELNWKYFLWNSQIEIRFRELAWNENFAEIWYYQLTGEWTILEALKLSFQQYGVALKLL